MTCKLIVILLSQFIDSLFPQLVANFSNSNSRHMMLVKSLTFLFYVLKKFLLSTFETCFEYLSFYQSVKKFKGKQLLRRIVLQKSRVFFKEFLCSEVALNPLSASVALIWKCVLIKLIQKCCGNQLTGFYMRATLALNALTCGQGH